MMSGDAEGSNDRLAAARNLASARRIDGQYAEAARLVREVLGVQRRVLGDEHPDTLASAADLASSLSCQGKHSEAEGINREVLGARRRVLGEEHPDTLESANNLASSLGDQKKYAEAERINLLRIVQDEWTFVPIGCVSAVSRPDLCLHSNGRDEPIYEKVYQSRR